ncbi:MAG: hypothetical protein Q7J64_04865, partial [Elusimicrobiota bacterium]|nr:hypothetical protein [Elusimicrobiota bacterium]
MFDLPFPAMRLAICPLILLGAYAFPLPQAAPRATPENIFPVKKTANPASFMAANVVAVSTRYLSLYPASEDALLGRAFGWFMLKRFKDAAQDSRAFLTLNPWSQPAHDLLIS